MKRFILFGWTVFLMSGCAVPNRAYSPQTHSAWLRYLDASPFSNYSTGPSFPSRCDDIDAISLAGADPMVAVHLRSVMRWMNDLPVINAQANAVYNQALSDGRRWKPVGGWAGEKVGKASSSEDAGALERWINGKAGGWVGEMVVDLMAHASANGAAVKVMRPYFQRQKDLAMMESTLNARLGYRDSHSLKELQARLEGSVSQSTRARRSSSYSSYRRGRVFLNF